MKKFKYKGIGASGKIVTDKLEARDIRDAKKILNSKNIRVIELKEISGRNYLFSIKRKKSLTSAQISHFCRQFSIIISSGVNSITGLETLGERSDSPVLKSEINRIVSGIRVGATISETMQSPNSKFPKLLSSMVATGEATGKLDEVLRSMAIFYDKDYRVRQKIKSASTYPIILLIISFGMLFLFTSVMLPKITESIFEIGAELPFLTKVVMAIGMFMNQNWLIVLIILLFSVFLLSRYIKMPSGRLIKDKFIRKIPILGEGINCIVSMKFSRTLHLFVSTGCPILQGVEHIIDSIGNSLAERALVKARDGIVKGESLGSSLAESKYFDSLLVQMVSIGEQTGELESITNQMAEFYEQESEVYLNRLVAMVEPTMIILVGILVGILVASIFLPMISMYDAL